MNPKVFYKKVLALKSITESAEKSYLFSEDISLDNKKRFFTTDYDTLYKMSINQVKNYYENIEAGQQVKLHLDIDYKLKGTDNVNVDILLNESINLVNSKLKEYEIDDPKIIVLSASTKEKISLHIIYVNVCFDDIYKIKHFMQEIKSPLIDNKTIDLNIYRTGCFRLLWSSKIGKNNQLVFYKGINYHIEIDKDLFYDSLVCNIAEECYLVDYEMPIVKTKMQTKKIIKQIELSMSSSTSTQSLNSCSENGYDAIPLHILKQCVNCIDIKRADNYKDWLEIGSCLHYANNESFDIWHEWSKKSSSYSSKDECILKWNSFNFAKKSLLGIGTLRMYAKKDNSIEYSYINFPKGPKVEKEILKQLKDYEKNDLRDKFKSSFN